MRRRSGSGCDASPSAPRRIGVVRLTVGGEAPGNRRFEQATVDVVSVGDATYIPYRPRLALPCHCPRCLQPMAVGLVDDRSPSHRAVPRRRLGRRRRPRPTGSHPWGDLPQRPRLPVQRRRLPRRSAEPGVEPPAGAHVGGRAGDSHFPGNGSQKRRPVGGQPITSSDGPASESGDGLDGRLDRDGRTVRCRRRYRHQAVHAELGEGDR